MREIEALIFVIMILTAATLLLAHLISRYARRRLESKEILKAIELGHPLPKDPPKPRHSHRSDLRIGILMVSFAIGFALFLTVLENGEAVMVAAIPLFIGLGYLVNAFVGVRLGPDTHERDRGVVEIARSPGATGDEEPMGGAAEAPATTTSGPREGDSETAPENDREG